jgi:chaperonin GroEL
MPARLYAVGAQLVHDVERAVLAALEGDVPGATDVEAEDELLAGGAGVERELEQRAAKAVRSARREGVDGAVVAGKVLESKDEHFGFDAQEERYGDLIKWGIIDPAKVVRTALEDAASVSGLLITTEAMVADKPEPKGQGGGMPDMGGMGGMGGMM